jgi:hypothetical protein
MSKYSFEVKHAIIDLAPTCFWYWSSFDSFLDNCKVPKNIQERYPKEAYNKATKMRNVLNDLETSKANVIIQQIMIEFSKLRNAVDKDQLDQNKAKAKLEEFRKLLGSDSTKEDHEIENRLKKKVTIESGLRIQELKREKLRVLKKKVMDLGTFVENPQHRGFELERIFFELLDIEEFEYRKSYRTSNEQIDGSLKYEKFDYLLEIKWEAGVMKQRDFSIFDGKIKGKAQSTRGLFFAMNGFDMDVVEKLSGHEPRIILMDAQDFMAILEGRFTFADCMKLKVGALVDYGRMFEKL